MSSSNRHWPSMFKSKPTTNTTTSPNHQWHHDLNNPNFPNPRNPYTQGCNDEDRSPEPKPRWNPRPEQIRILESIFNSGTVNPPRDEIRRIRAQLQEFGQVGDANVFYWFQNRKSRSKHKLQRHLHTTKRRTPPPPPPSPPPFSTAAAISPGLAASSSSSSDKSSPTCNSNEKQPLSLITSTFIDLLNSPTSSENPPFLQGSSSFLAEPLSFSVGSNSAALTHGVCFPNLTQNCSNDLLGDLMLMNHGRSSKYNDDHDEDDQKVKIQQRQISYDAPVAADLTIPSPTNHIPQGPGLVEPAPPKSTVFINDVCFEVVIGVPFNVREAFGDDVVLVQSSGQPVPTDEWGFTQQPLQHGAFYYLLRAFAPSPDDRTIDLI